jgi:hypothetical protein
MPAPSLPAIPHCRAAPPWTDCGDPRSPTFGSVFAEPAANGALALYFDRRARRHAITVFDAREVGDEIVVYGRRFTVVRDWAPAR